MIHWVFAEAKDFDTFWDQELEEINPIDSQVTIEEVEFQIPL